MLGAIVESESFRDVTFTGTILFNQFKADFVDFTGARFDDHADFDQVSFRGETTFDNVRFTHRIPAEVAEFGTEITVIQ